MTNLDRGLRAGDTVIIRQISGGSGRPMVREIGAGVLAAAPEVGERLRIELRRGRGLASSLVTDLRVVDEGQVAVKTEGRVYVLSEVARSREPGDADLQRVVTELLEVAEPLTLSGDTETEYVRMLPVDPKEERRIRVTRSRDGVEEPFGEGEILGEIEVGECLRFTSEDGRILGTSMIQMVRQTSPSCLEIETGNSSYVVEFLCGELPG